jgi:RNA polymerase sigma-70 factor (ECF subfamily)
MASRRGGISRVRINKNGPLEGFASDQFGNRPISKSVRLRHIDQTMNSTSEQDLLYGARKYDLATLGAIYDRYSPGIYRYARRLLDDDCLAEDCVSETFSRFLKSLRAGQGPQDHLQAYLYRIAHNWITDSYRRQPLPPLELDDSWACEIHTLPEQQAEANIKQNQVRLALRSLTPEQSQVILLRFIEGWENEEVAAALQKPVGAIKALQHRAINTLKRILLREEKEVTSQKEDVYEPKT